MFSYRATPNSCNARAARRKPRNIHRQAECFAGRSKGLFSRAINAVARNKRRQRKKKRHAGSPARRAVLTSADSACEISSLWPPELYALFPHRAGAASQNCGSAEFYAWFNYLQSSLLREAAKRGSGKGMRVYGAKL